MLHQLSSSQDFVAPWQMPAFWPFPVVKGVLQPHPLQSLNQWKRPPPPAGSATGLRQGEAQGVGGPPADAFPLPLPFWGPLSMLKPGRQNLQKEQKCFYLPAALVISPLLHGNRPKGAPPGRHLMILWKALWRPFLCIVSSHRKSAPANLFQPPSAPIPCNPLSRFAAGVSCLSDQSLGWGSIAIIQAFHDVHLTCRRRVHLFPAR